MKPYKNQFKPSANRETALYDFTGREINKPFPTNKDLGDRTRNMGANYRKQTSGIDESIMPSPLPSDYRLTALTTSFDWCALKIQNMQKAREALEILHSQDLDGLSGSVQMQDEKSEADSGQERPHLMAANRRCQMRTRRDQYFRASPLPR